MPGLKERRTAARAIEPNWRASLDESVVSVDWSSSGLWLAAATAAGTVSIFEGVSGDCVQQLPAHRFGATRVAWHPHAALFASAGQDGTVCLWQARVDGLLSSLDCGAEWVEHIAWSPTGDYLATAAGRKLKLWSKEGDLVREYPDHPHTIAAITWSSQGEELVSACYGRLQFWAPNEAQARRTFSWKGSMLTLAWSPDGRYLCHGNQDATVHFWVVKTGKELQMWGYPTKVRELAWDHRSRFLATGGGHAITVWNCSGKGPANTKPSVLEYHDVSVTRLAYQRSGPILASGCGGGRVALWKPSKRAVPDATDSLPGAIVDLAWSSDDKLLAAGVEDGSVAAYSCSQLHAC